MNNKQINERQLVVNLLGEAGWIETEHSKKFETEFWLYKEAVLDYDNTSMKMTVEYCAENEDLTYMMTDVTNMGIILRIVYGDKLAEILNLIVSFQNAITSDNYKRYIKKLINVSPKVSLDLGEEGGLTELVDDTNGH